MNEGLNIHSLPPLLVSIIFFLVPFSVLLKNKRSAVNRNFFVLGFCASLWQFSYFVAYNLTQTSSILFWLKIAYAGVVFVPAATYHFIISFLNLSKNRCVYLFYSLASLFAFIALRSNSIIIGARTFPWGNRPVVGMAYTLIIFLWVIPFALSLRHLYREQEATTSPYNKKRIKFLLMTFPVALLSVVDYLPNYGLNMYPLGFIPLLFFGFATSYAIVRYRLLDIEIIVKKASLVAVGFVLAMSLIYLGTSYFQPYLYALGGKNWIIFPIIISFLTGTGLLRFINFVRHIEENELSKRFAYRPILRREALRISEARNMNELITYVARDLSSWVRLDYIGIFILDVQSKKFVLARSLTRTKKRKKIPLNLGLTYDNPLVIELVKRRGPLIYSEIEYYLNTTEISAEEEKLLLKVMKEMQRLGAEIAIPSFCEGNLLAIINMGHKLNPHEIITHEDLETFVSLANNMARAFYGFMLKKEKTRLIVASQNTLISAIEAKDSYTRGHTDRVAHYTTLLGQKLERQLRTFSYDLHRLNWSAQLHDVGKIGIPDSILRKPGPLNEEEWVKIKEHPLDGMKIVGPVREWLGEDICAGMLHHHENYDGSGYPSQQKGEGIHVFARIIRVADAFDAMASERAYRPPLSKKATLKELSKYRGIHFDPDVVEVLEDIQQDLTV
ncbi:MAG: HD domain-containing protein [Candidatus Omnitrophota bacterium]|nr:MAG: HD domain-containing protein [Candidatus Omnitrophota bacterium]